MTRDFKRLNLLAKLMALHRQILFSLTISAIAEAIVMRTSAEQVSSLHMVFNAAYLKLVNSSNFWPFVLVSARTLSVLLVMILLVSVPTSIPYAVAPSTSLLIFFPHRLLTSVCYLFVSESESD